MSLTPFRFNSEAKYQPGLQKAAARDVGDLRKGRVRVQSDAPQKWFEAQYPDVFEHYLLPTSYSAKSLQVWRTPMQFWQNQLNFAVWCATTGCGVSVEDHLTAAEGLLQSVYRFHAYYQIRRILVEMQAPLPQDRAWNALNNPYDRRGYEKICDEFGVSPNSDWKVSGPNQGFGPVYYYWTRFGYIKVGDGEYDPKEMSFTHPTEGLITHVDYIKQETDAVSRAWRLFILDKSNGFTCPGVNRLNDSIMTYVWAVLGAQAQVRTGILGVGAAFGAQAKFLANVADVISAPVDVSAAVNRYQDVLQYARSEVNFSFGEGLYMAPGDMLLRIGKIAGYNNLLVVATHAQSLRLNSGLNKVAAPPDAANDTGEKGLVNPVSTAQPLEATTSQPGAGAASAKPDLATTASAKADHEDHEDEKALVVGGIAIGLGLLWFLR